jgi:hypothetical protein
MIDQALDELVRSSLEYDAATGKLLWRKSPSKKFQKGSEAGGYDLRGYLCIKVGGVPLKGHRIAWFLHFGQWPTGEVDHINCNKSDNRIDNLRVVSHAENSRNRPAQANNSSGFKGVHFCSTYRKFRAQIGIEGRRIALGYFESAEQAAKAYEKAASEIHGAFKFGAKV